MTILTRQERERLVIDLYYNQGKTYREICKEARISPRDIGAILNKVDEEKTEGSKEEQDDINSRNLNQEYEQRLSISAQAYKLFSDRKSPLEVAIALNLRESEATKLYIDYWKLKRLHILNLILKETNGKLGPFLKLYRLIKEKGMSIEQVVNAVEIVIHKLPYMESLYKQAEGEVEKMQFTVQRLANEMEERKNKISFLDKIAFSSEQECKRTEQRVQGLTDKKDKLEKLIANILNEEGYSMIKHIIKENIKVVLSENKKLISISSVALIQTIKADPQMVNLILNIPSANDSEQHKDNNNIIKYLELNKDRILKLGEKNYENVVEALTNNAVDTAATSSYNPTLSLPQSSSTFPNLSTQSGTYGIEKESEIYDNSKGDNSE